MNKGKKYAIVISSAVILSIISITTALILFWNNDDSKESEDSSDEETSQEITVELDEEILQNALENAVTDAQYDDTSAATPEYLKKMESVSNYRIFSFTRNENYIASAIVEVSSPSLYAAVKSLENQQFSSYDEMDNALVEYLETADHETHEILIIFTYDGTKWIPSLTDSFADAYYGGLLTLREEYYESMYKRDW